VLILDRRHAVRDQVRDGLIDDEITKGQGRERTEVRIASTWSSANALLGCSPERREAPKYSRRTWPIIALARMGDLRSISPLSAT